MDLTRAGEVDAWQASGLHGLMGLAGSVKPHWREKVNPSIAMLADAVTPTST